MNNSNCLSKDIIPYNETHILMSNTTLLANTGMIGFMATFIAELCHDSIENVMLSFSGRAMNDVARMSPDAIREKVAEIVVASQSDVMNKRVLIIKKSA
jgi:hypothetical protein